MRSILNEGTLKKLEIRINMLMKLFLVFVSWRSLMVVASSKDTFSGKVYDDIQKAREQQYEFEYYIFQMRFL